MIRGGSYDVATYGSVALDLAKTYAGPDRKTLIYISDLDTITESFLADCMEKNIQIGYSQVDTVEQMETLYQHPRFGCVQYWACSEFNIRKWLDEKLQVR